MKFLFAILAFLLCFGAFAQRQRTTRGSVKKARTEKRAQASSGVVIMATGADGTDAADSLEFYGYQKALTSTQETLFVHNASSRDVEAVWVTIKYFDTAGRELHSRSVRLAVEVPGGTTRRVDFPSWDRQREFYYASGPRPRRSAIPYTVSVIADSLLIVYP